MNKHPPPLETDQTTLGITSVGKVALRWAPVPTHNPLQKKATVRQM
jgi:hypothetical protein